VGAGETELCMCVHPESRKSAVGLPVWQQHICAHTLCMCVHICAAATQADPLHSACVQDAHTCIECTSQCEADVQADIALCVRPGCTDIHRVCLLV
jgi:hypothetical protein